MRIGLTFEAKERGLDSEGVPDADSELLSRFEVDELLSGLRDAGHIVHLIGGVRQLLNRAGYWRNRCDLVFNKSVGRRGIDRKVHAAAILDTVGIPYVGSGPYALALTRHKYHTKLVVERAGVLTPEACMVPPGTMADLANLSYPVIIKPVGESSSIGITKLESIANDPGAALRRAREITDLYRQPALVECFVRGAEIEVPLVMDPEPRALGTVAIAIGGRPIEGRDFLTSDVVYGDGYGFAPPPTYVDCGAVEAAAIRACRSLDLRDYGRMDFRVEQDGRCWLIEASSHPHLQRHSSFYFLAQADGRPYAEMLDDLLQVAARRVGLA